MKGIYFASFYFRVCDLTCELRENKNPVEIYTYTVISLGREISIRKRFKSHFFTKGLFILGHNYVVLPAALHSTAQKLQCYCIAVSHEN